MYYYLLFLYVGILLLFGVRLGGMGAAIWMVVGVLGLLGSFGGIYWEVWSVMGVVYISGIVAMALYMSSTDMAGVGFGSITVVVLGGFVTYSWGAVSAVEGSGALLFSEQSLFVFVMIGLFLLGLMFVSSHILGGSVGPISLR